MSPLNPRHARFVAEYLKDLNGSQAVVRAGFRCKSMAVAGATAARLLKNVKVKAAVDEALAQRALRVEIKADDVLRELHALAMADIGGAYDEKGRLLPLHEMSPDVRKTIRGIKVFEEYAGSGEDRVKIGEVREVKFYDKKGALELLGKHLGILSDQMKHKLDEDTMRLLSLTPDERLKYLDALAVQEKPE